MKKSQTTEQNFEVEHVVKVLMDEHGFTKRVSAEDFSKEYYLDTELLLEFIRETQAEEWQKHQENYPEDAEEQFLSRLHKELSSRGTLDVLKEGIKDRGAHFDLAYFKPVSGLNPEHKENYEANKFSIIRQLVYASDSGKSLDVCLFLNGIPIITAELKNQLTGQSYTDAIEQYRRDRDPKEPLLDRTLVHFAVDNDDVYFATKLAGKQTTFLPFNKDVNNPSDPRGFKVAYLYHDIWQPDSLLEIIHDYMRIVEEEDDHGQVKKKLIFPRYHQLSTVRRAVATAHEKGPGKNYLVQHSTGSGKTFTISWLAHHLSQIHEGDDRIYDTVVVVSDRRVIDRQLEEAVHSFQETKGVVTHAKSSSHLGESLKAGKNIIVTTAQKFPYIVEEIAELPSSTFAVLIDEAHSGQGGKMSRSLNKTFSYGSLEEAEDEDPEVPSLEDMVAESVQRQGRRDNVSYFAFTATPKPETFELFGEDNGKPFSLYSMRQAIEEGFILDVLKNYISYQTYFKLVKKIESDPEYSQRKVTGLLRQYVDLHEHPIQRKTEVILDHFLQNVKGEIGGKAKAMIVTKSRLHAVRYKLEVDKQLKEQGSDVKTLVAFTGTVEDGGNSFTEPRMNNGIPESQTKEEFDKPEYRILIVASKYQTGFDQPLLQTMYVDKKLNGINAVQTLSRLNRKAPGKEYATVLDFVNRAEEIQAAFEPYFDETILSEHIDPNELYDLEREIEQFRVLEPEEIEEFARVWFNPNEDDQSLLHRALEPAVARYNDLVSNKDDQNSDYTKERFRNLLREFTKTYALIVQVVKFEDTELEKLYQYCRFLLKKLPLEREALPKEVLEAVDMDSFGIRKQYEGEITPSEEPGELEPVEPQHGAGVVMDDRDRLSEIIQKVNAASGADELTEADKLKVEQLGEKVRESKKFQDSKPSNSREDMRLLFKDIFREELGDMYESDNEFYRKVNQNEEMKEVLKEELFKMAMSG